MDYFKNLAGDKVTVDIGRVSDHNLTDVLREYTKMGYREFSLELVQTNTPAEYKVLGRGDRDIVKKRVAKWYPDLLDE